MLAALCQFNEKKLSVNVLSGVFYEEFFIFAPTYFSNETRPDNVGSDI
jgi:hypothetical protein